MSLLRSWDAEDNVGISLMIHCCHDDVKTYFKIKFIIYVFLVEKNICRIHDLIIPFYTRFYKLTLHCVSFILTTNKIIIAITL